MSGKIIDSRVEDVFTFPEKIQKHENETQKHGNVEETIKTIDDNKNKVELGCDICKIRVTSARILQRHLEGRKHKMREERQGKVFRCNLCDVTANSEIQLEIHMKSSRHKAKLQRKEYSDFINSPGNGGIWILFFCALCIFVNLILLFKTSV